MDIPELSCFTTILMGSLTEAKADRTLASVLSFNIRSSFQYEIFPKNISVRVDLERVTGAFIPLIWNIGILYTGTTAPATAGYICRSGKNL
jgi:hypothetical protein